MSVEAKTIVIAGGVGRVARWFSWSVCILLCAFVALVSYRYFFGVDEAPPVIANNAFRNPWLLVHVAGAATALLLGPLQFPTRLRARFRKFHHWIGRIYVVSCLVGGAAGFVLALGASTGPISKTGFGALAIAWIVRDVTRMASRDAVPLRSTS